MAGLKATAALAAMGGASVVLQGCGMGPGPSHTTTTTLCTTTTPFEGAIPHCTRYTEDMKECLTCEDAYDLISNSCFLNCRSELRLEGVAMNRKGMCLDDTTFQYCTDEIPYMWPNTNEPLRSLRLFSSWQSFWPDEGRKQAWKSLLDIIKKNSMQVLVGTQVTCDEKDDDRDWKEVLELVKLLGPRHMMGIAVGNEMELLHLKQDVSSSCISRMWKGGYFWRKTQERIRDLDALGEDFRSIPVSSVFGAAILGGDPFVETPQAMVTSYLRNATEAYGRRWTFIINIYPYLDPNDDVDEPGSDKCEKAIHQCTCFQNEHCIMVSILATLRRKMGQVTGNEDDRLWIGETGWSSPQASTLSSKVAACPDFSSPLSFERNYRSFLNWDLTFEMPGVRGPDHVFYFTMRDSSNFGMEEHFGLIGSCGDRECKLNETVFDMSTVPPATTTYTPYVTDATRIVV